MPNLISLLIAFIFLAIPSFASVLPVSLERLSTSAQLVFEGEVTGTHSVFNAKRTAIHTYVQFRVVDVVKGAYGPAEIELRFLGGTVGEVSLDVSESTLPELGERGIYFVSSLDRFQVNPLCGMDQGHFLILESSGQRIMATRSKRVITGLSSASRSSLTKGLSDGVSPGLSLADAGGSEGGMTVSEFVQVVRQYAGKTK